ncbi:MAG: ABC transporter ATP-binding protein [Aristaeellaceae bacterium]
MGVLLREIWTSDRKAFLRILGLNILASLLGGIGIVMLIPLLHLLNIGTEDGSLLSQLAAPVLNALPYTGQVLLLLGAYILLVTLKALLNRHLGICETTFTETTSLRLRNQLYDAMSTAGWETLSARKSTDTINLFVSQCAQVSHGIDAIIHLITSLVSAAIQLGIALWMNAPMTLCICLLGGAMMGIFLPLRKKSRAYGDEMIRINRAFYAELENQLGSVKEVRAYGVEGEHAARFRQTSEEFVNARLKYVRMCSVPQVVYSVAAACIIAGVYLLSALVLHVSTDRLVVLVYIFARLWPVFSGLQGQIQGIYSCVPAYEKLSAEIQAMQASPEQTRANQADDSAFDRWQSIRFDDVSFAYRDANEETLRHVDFTIRSGSVTALLGRNGSGKTTTVNLLLGFLQPSGGQITVDGVALSPENIRAWRRQVGYVPQDPIILNASVRENLTRFHPAATDEELIAALKTAMAWDFVRALPQGLDTPLGDRGVRLSGGERQRIVLARVLIGMPRLIVLDEATSALDYESETAFREVVRTMSRDIAVIVIAHRLATIQSADQAIVLEDGRIAEMGDTGALIQHQYDFVMRQL